MKKIVLSRDMVRRLAAVTIIVGVGLLYAPLLVQVSKPGLLRANAYLQNQLRVKAYDYYFGDDYAYEEETSYYEEEYYSDQSETYNDCYDDCYDGYDEDYFDYPELGINAPITLDDATDPFDYNDWHDIRDSLRHGVSLSHDSEYQNFEDLRDFYIIGHSSDYNIFNKYSFIFAGLKQGQQNDNFVVHMDGKKYTYRVTGQEILDPYQDKERFTALRDHDASVQRAMIVTCYPAFSTNKRLVLIGERTL